MAVWYPSTDTCYMLQGAMLPNVVMEVVVHVVEVSTTSSINLGRGG